MSLLVEKSREVAPKAGGQRSIPSDDGVRPAEDGFILLPVLWLIGLFAFASLMLARTTVADVQSASRRLQEAEAEMAADGVARLAMWRLASTPDAASARGSGPATDGTPIQCEMGGMSAMLRIFDTAGQIDLNVAPKELLERMFAGLGYGPFDAARLAAGIVDFRDEDDVVTLGSGSEIEQYRLAGVKYGPKNSSFATVSEVEQVLGIDDQLAARLRPLVTVYSRMKAVDQAVASAEIRALQLPSDLAPRPAQVSFFIQAAVAGQGGARFVREAVITLTSRGANGFVLREWGRGNGRSGALLPVAGDFPNCLAVLGAGQ